MGGPNGKWLFHMSHQRICQKPGDTGGNGRDLRQDHIPPSSGRQRLIFSYKSEGIPQKCGGVKCNGEMHKQRMDFVDGRQERQSEYLSDDEAHKGDNIKDIKSRIAVQVCGTHLFG